MKVIAFNGSSRKDGNTALMINTVFEVLHDEGIETEMVQLAHEHPHGCIACYQCFERRDGYCAIGDDCVNACLEKMIEADGIILASPTYFADISSKMKALIERAAMTMRANDDMLQRKPGAAIVTKRRAGAIHAFHSLNHFFTIGQMLIVGSSYWNVGIGQDQGDVAGDEEGLTTMRDLGKNMAWLMKKIYM